MIEICCGSYMDGLTAYNGGAKRIELNSALSVGGLTPSLASLIRIKKETSLKVICMVRPRAAGFCYEKDEVELMFDEAKLFLENGADGIAFGFLNSDYTIDIKNTSKMVELIHSYDKEAVFHRAFDVTKDPFDSIEVLISLKVDRVLTSGQEDKAIDGKELLKILQNKYGSQIEILAGSGINYNNAKDFMEYTGIKQIHSSCKSFKNDVTTKLNNVSYSYLNDDYAYDVVDETLVKKLIKSVQQ